MPQEPIQYPPPPAELQGKPTWRLIRFFGAGAIIASVTIGSGETLFASRGGAVFGYTLLWCFVGGTLLKGVQVYTAARYITLTGAHPMAHWAHLPGPKNWVPILIGLLSLACFPFWLAALPRFVGQLINWVFHVAESEDKEYFDRMARIWGTITIVAAVTLTWVQSYGALERVQTVIVGLLLFSIILATFVSRPDWVAAFMGTIVPVVPDYQDWIKSDYPKIAIRSPWVEMVTYLGAIGGGSYDYIGYIGCLREKKWGALGLKRSQEPTPELGKKGELLPIEINEDNVKRGRVWLRAAKIDVGVSFSCVLIFTVCFYALGAAILHQAHLAPEGRDVLVHQAAFLTKIHPSLLYLYQIGVLAAFLGTIYGAYEIYTRTTYECLAPLSRRIREMPEKQVRLPVLLYCGVGGLILLWTVDDPIKLVTLPAIVGGVLTCGLWCFAMIWTERRFLPKAFRMRRSLLVLTVIAGTFLVGLAIPALWNFFA